MDEQIFIAQLKQQDAAAFRKLVHEYGDRVFNSVLGMLQQRENAEDVAQEVFAEVFQGIKHFKAEARLSTWIYRIAVTKSLEFIRNKNRKKRAGFLMPLFGMEETLEADKGGMFYHPGVVLENKQRAAVLFKAIARLPETQQACFVLNKVEGLSYAEVADIVNKPVSAVENLLVRAKQNLQKWLKGYYRENE